MAQPKKVAYTAYYWDCGLDRGCRHKTKAAALKCIERNAGASKPGETQKRKIKREIQACDLRNSGMTFAQIGERLGVGASRANQIVRSGERAMRHPRFNRSDWVE